MIVFENQDEEYLQWLETHEHGFVLNRRASPDSTYMIHTARCSHINYPAGEYTHTVNRKKACSEEIGDLQTWAKQHSLSVVECGSCKPYA